MAKALSIHGLGFVFVSAMLVVVWASYRNLVRILASDNRKEDWPSETSLQNLFPLPLRDDYITQLPSNEVSQPCASLTLCILCIRPLWGR